MAKAGAVQAKPAKSAGKDKRKYLSQTDVPASTLDQAMRVPRAILDEHAGQPTTALDVAHVLRIQPTSGPFRMLCGASIAYGLTDGGYNADRISVTDLARRIANGTEAEMLAARREATLKPRVIREFLQRYDGSKMPREDVAMNVLTSMGVPPDAVKRSHELIVEAAKAVKFFKDINGTLYVDLKNTPISSDADEDEVVAELEHEEEGVSNGKPIAAKPIFSAPNPPTAGTDSMQPDGRERKVFVTHGKNRLLIPQIKELLEFGQLEPLVSVERESVAQPVPDKVMSDMRACGAAVIHVDADEQLMTPDGQTKVLLNSNVLIEIGAAMALYGRRFILLVRDGITVPSNMQNLYEVRYTGDKLDGDATLRLLKAFSELKKLPLERVG